MAIVYLLIGGNLGDRQSLLKEAKGEIELQVGGIMLKSSIYETEPWGFKDDQQFLNQLLMVKTDLSANGVLTRGLQIELSLGRDRSHQKMGSRTMDIDILFYDQLILENEELIIPHPRLHLRRFALVPLNEIAENWIHPSMNKSMKQLLLECTDRQKVTLCAN